MQKTTRLLYLLALIKFILPFFLQNTLYEPHRDEFLYLAEGHHIAWGFMEVPPLLSVFAWLTHLFGDSMFWIKCWPSLFGALTYILTGRIILSLGGKSYALFMGFLPFVLGAYLRVHYLFQPNFLEIFFWTMIAWSMIHYVQTEQNKWLYIFGVSVGLGMLSKYSVAFFVISILIGLLLTKQRKVFANKHLYFSALFALVIFLPNLIWQYNRHFPVVYHMNKLQQTQLQYISPGSFLIDQLIMNFPCFFIWLVGLWFVSFSSKSKPYRFVGWAYVSVIVLLLIGHGKNYYALGVYPVLFAFGAYRLEQLTAIRFKIWRYVFAVIPLVFIHAFVPVALPVFAPERLEAFYKNNHTDKLGVLKWEDGKNHPLPQDFSDMLGWEEMAKKMAKAYETLDSNEKKNTILFCDNYGQAGAVNFYADKYHLPQAYSDNASFLYWMPDSLHFDNLVLLTDDEHEMEHPFIKNFKSAVLADSIVTNYAREKGDLILILKGGDADFKKMFIKKIEKDKAKVSVPYN
jgi:hypothetical protein